MKPSKINFWQYQFIVLSRAVQKAWNTFGALGTIFGLLAAIIAGLLLGNGEALLTALISFGILFLVAGFFFIIEPVAIYNEQQSRIKNLSADDVAENSIDVSHFATSALNAIELRYVTGNEPIKILKVELLYLDKRNQNVQSQVEQFYSSNDSLNSQVNLSILNIGESVRFHCPSKDETNEVIVRVQLSGAKTKKRLDIEKVVQLKANQVWLMS